MLLILKIKYLLGKHFVHFVSNSFSKCLLDTAYVVGTGLSDWNISEHNRQDLCPHGVHVLVEGGKTAQIRSHTHSNIKNSHNMLEDIHVKKKKR